MNNKITYIFLIYCFICLNANAIGSKDSTSVKDYSIEEVVVTGTKNATDIKHLPMTVSVVNRQNIENRYEQSLLPTLTEQVPGLFTTSRGIMGYGVSTGASGGISIRGIGGSPTTRMLVLIDGHPQYMGLMGHPIADSYQSMLAERVEIIRSPASVLYGSNAMGGVMNIVTRKIATNGIHTNARVMYGSYNTLVTEATNQIRKGKFNSSVSLSYNRTDGHRTDMEFEQYGGYAKLGYDFNHNWQAFADINLTHFNASNPGTVSTPISDNDSHITRGMTSFSLENNYKHTSGALKIFYNWGKHKINDGYEKDKKALDYRFNSRDEMFGLSWYQSIVLFRGNRLTAGIDCMQFGGEAWNHYLTDEHNSDIANKSENEIAGYVDFRQTFVRIFTFDAGLRIDRHSQTGTEWIPQVGLSVQPSINTNIKLMTSKGFRNPTIRELYMFRPANPDLLPEKLWNYEISYTQQLLNYALSYGFNIFYIDGDNLIQTIPVNGRPMNVNTGKIENYGIETNLNYRINKLWQIYSNYSWLKMKYPVIAAPEHKFFTGIDFSKGKWNFSTGVQYIRGLYTSISPEKKENFILWNLRGSYKPTNWISLFVRGENLLAQSYEINAGYPMPKATIMGGINLNF